MNWGKVISKFLKGFVMGGVSAVAANPSAIINTQDAQQAGIAGLVVAVLSSALNWWKHKND